MDLLVLDSILDELMALNENDEEIELDNIRLEENTNPPNRRTRRNTRSRINYKNAPDYIKKFCKSIWEDRFKWGIVKSLLIFFLAVEITKQIEHIIIPLKEYIPFDTRR